MDLDAALAQLHGSFPTVAEFQGVHFKYAAKGGTVLIESRKFDAVRQCPVYFYWILADGRFKLIHASQKSRLSAMRTIDEKTFTRSEIRS